MGISPSKVGRRQGDLAEGLEGDLDGHVEHQGLGGLRAADDVGHHPRALFKLDHGDGVWVLADIRARAMVDHIAPEHGLAGSLVALDLARAADRTERPGREIALGTFDTALKAKLAFLAAVPEMLGLRRGLRKNSVHGCFKS
jgi:hypothetical protein